MHTPRFLALLAMGLAVGACSSILGLSTYHDAQNDASTGGSAGAEAGAGAGGVDSGTGGTGATGGTGGSGATGGTGGGGTGGTGGSGGATGCQPVGNPVKILDSTQITSADLDGNNLGLIVDGMDPNNALPRLFAVVGKANGDLTARGVTYSNAGLTLQSPASLSGVGKPLLGGVEFVTSPKKEFVLHVYTDTGWEEDYSFSTTGDGGTAGYVAGNMTTNPPVWATGSNPCNSGSGSTYTLASLVYSFYEGFHLTWAATCDDPGVKRYVSVGGNASQISGAASESDLFLQGFVYSEYGAESLLVLGPDSNVLRFGQFGSAYPTIETLDLSGGDAGSPTSSVLGTWQWQGPDGEGGVDNQLGMIGALQSGSSMTLFSGVAGTPADFNALETTPLKILKSRITTAPLSIPGSPVVANDNEAWWAGTDPAQTSVTMLRFAATTGVPGSPPYVVYSTGDGGTKTVTQAVAAPFNLAGAGLVMWSQIDGASATVYAQAVKCPP